MIDYFDGEMHELFAGQDWQLVENKVVAWVDREPPDKDLGDWETPDRNWVTAPLTPSEMRIHGVAGGWSNIANMLQAISKALGGRPVCYQKGKRFFFQHKEE